MNGMTAAFTGHVGSEPETRYTSTGKSMLTFSVVVDENSTATEAKPAPAPQWVKVTAWEDKATELDGQLSKGCAVYVEGRLKLDRWTAQDGQQRFGLSLSAWTVQPMGQIGKRRPELVAAAASRGKAEATW
jgi:single-strand DNA-binding protein